MKPISDNALSVSDNSGVLGYLEELSSGDGMIHPDITQRLDEIRQAVSGLSLRRHLRSHVLVNVESQVIVAAAFGTGYAINVGQHLADAIKSGKNQRIVWSDGTSLNLKSRFGCDWIAGSFDINEIHWLAATIDTQQDGGGTGANAPHHA